MTGIYKIESPAGSVYIGQSKNINRRWYNLKRHHCPRPILLVESFKKYGVVSHTFEVSHELPNDVSQHVLDSYEQFYISQYESAGVQALNIQKGGIRPKHSNSTRLKLIGRIKSLETCNKISMSKKNVPLPEWRKEQNRIAQTGRKHTESHKLKCAQASLKPVIQYSKSGDFIKEWESIKKAHNELRISRNSISGCVHFKLKSAGGFVWRLKA